MTSQIEEQEINHREVKLSCRNIWKVYGDQIGPFFGGPKDTFTSPVERANFCDYGAFRFR